MFVLGQIYHSDLAGREQREDEREGGHLSGFDATEDTIWAVDQMLR